MQNQLKPKLSINDAATMLGVTPQAVHLRVRNNQFKLSLSGNKQYLTHAEARAVFSDLLPKYKKTIIAIHNVRGGVGKTTLANSIAVRASLYGAKVLCIDADKQGNLTESFNVDADGKKILFDLISDPALSIKDCIIPVTDGIDLIPSRIENSLIDRLINSKGGRLDLIYPKILKGINLLDTYDLVLFDCPPEIGFNVQSIMFFCDYSLTPVTPDKYSLNGLRVIDQMFDAMVEDYKPENRPYFRVLFNKYDNRTKLSFHMLKMVQDNPVYSANMFNCFIQTNSDFPNQLNSSISSYDNLKHSTSKEDIDVLVREILGLE
ncbi:MAG: ParA family protein [Nitrospirae bacterium]|nr:ParA family protein [Nitrospirota bacterium]